VCAIFGIVDLHDRPAMPAWLDPMAAVSTHRGPDDEGRHSDGPCAIGMRRLSIIDVAGGHQPIADAGGKRWVVCNGEIYNFRELRRELEALGHRFTTGSDSEAVLHAYCAWGDAFVQRLNGMFGFALWDGVRRRLVLGRDRLGVKPLYYTLQGGRLAFASEAKALLELPGVPREVDAAALRAYFDLGYVPAPLSMFRGIAKLPPASLLVVEDGRHEVRAFWRLPNEVEADVDERDWAERVRAHLERSVRMQMVSDVPIGAFLSGGLDSSAVVAFMARASDRPIRTYSIGFEGAGAGGYYNELPYARTVAQRFATEHHEILVRPDVVELLPKLLWHMDEPIADSAFLTTFLVSEFARREVKVILSGVGGDELFGGYRRYLGDHYRARFSRLPAPLRKAAAGAARLLPNDRHSALANLARYARAFMATADAPLEHRYRSYVEVFPRGEVAALLCGPPAEAPDAIAAAFQAADGADALNRMMVVDLMTQLPDDLLLLTDKMSMAASLECRVPLLDHELVELTARIPERVKLARGELKALMKRALAGVLPQATLARRKRGFGAPIGAWFKSDLAGLLGRVLDRRAVARRGLFSFDAVQQTIDAHVRARVDGTDRLLALLNLEIWARVYLDRRGHADVAAELKEKRA
jgi:asparagine synthase (glutamine-hydrolysing)